MIVRSGTGPGNAITHDHIRYAPGEVVPRYEYEAVNVCLLLTGHCVERRAGVSHRHAAPSLTINLPADAHELVLGDAGGRCLSVDLPAEWLADLEEAGPLRVRPVVALSDPRPVFAAVRLHRELLGADAGMTNAAAEEALLEVLSLAGERGPGETAGPRGSPPHWLLRVRERLDDTLADAPGLSVLAAEAGVHRVHLARLFQRYFGMSVGECARRNRLRHALHEIANTADDLGRIAVRAGYFDQAHFNRRFREDAGMTPTRFRDLVRDRTV